MAESLYNQISDKSWVKSLLIYLIITAYRHKNSTGSSCGVEWCMCCWCKCILITHMAYKCLLTMHCFLLTISLIDNAQLKYNKTHHMYRWYHCDTV